MSAHTGESAQETGDFRCERCHQQTHVAKGHKIPRCAHCGNDEFDARYHEPGNKSS
jgi:ribosomal protein L37AE/L43A